MLTKPSHRNLSSVISRWRPSKDLKDLLDDNENNKSSNNENTIHAFPVDAEPYRDLLSLSARATWRMTPASLPPSLAQARQNLLDQSHLYTGDKHTKPTLLHMIDAQHQLRDKRETERINLFRNRDPNQTKKKKKKGQQKQKAAPDAGSLHYGPQQAAAMLKHRLYPQYAMNRRVLRELASLMYGASPSSSSSSSLAPRRILDFGTGCGSGAAAAWDVFGHSLEWIHLVDASQTMREVSEALLQDLVQQTLEESSQADGDNDNNVDETNPSPPPPPRMGLAPPRITTAAHLSTSSEGNFDLCLSSFTMSDLPNTSSILAATALLYAKLKPGGFLVLLEPGTPDGFANVRMIRNMLLDCCPEDSDDTCRIIAPCTHCGSCPIERYGHPQKVNAEEEAQEDDFDDDGEDADDNNSFDANSDTDEDEEEDDAPTTRIGYCSFVQTMAGFSRRRRGEKLSYLVVQKKPQDEHAVTPAATTVVHPNHFDATIDEWRSLDLADHLQRRLRVRSDQPMHPLLQQEAEHWQTKYLNSDEDDLGLEFLRNPDHRRKFGRIIEAPKKRRGHVLINCCVDGRIERHKISKRDNAVAPGLFGAARKGRWGGFWVTTDATKVNE